MVYHTIVIDFPSSPSYDICESLHAETHICSDSQDTHSSNKHSQRRTTFGPWDFLNCQGWHSPEQYSVGDWHRRMGDWGDAKIEGSRAEIDGLCFKEALKVGPAVIEILPELKFWTSTDDRLDRTVFVSTRVSWEIWILWDRLWGTSNEYENSKEGEIRVTHRRKE